MEKLKAKLDNVKLSDNFDVSFDTENKKEGNTHSVKVSYDFSGVTIEEVLEPAIKKLNIKVQDILRKSFPTAEAMEAGLKEEYSYKVATLLSPTRRKLTPAEKAERATAQMTPEQVKEMIAKLAEQHNIAI